MSFNPGNTCAGLLILITLLGCDPVVQEYNLSPEEINRVQRVQNPFGNKRYSLPGSPGRYVGLRECKLYRSVQTEGIVVGWEPLVLKSVWITGCVAKVQLEGPWVTVTYCGRVLGLTSTSESYRTTDGEKWYEQSDDEGKLVPGVHSATDSSQLQDSGQQ